MQSCTDLPIYRFTLLKQEWHRDQIYGGRILAHSKPFSDLYLHELAAVKTGNLSLNPLQFGKENRSTILYWKTKKASPLLLQNGLHMSEFIWWYKLLSINLTRLPKAFLVPKKKATHLKSTKESKGFVFIKPYIHQIKRRTLIITICKDFSLELTQMLV